MTTVALTAIDPTRPAAAQKAEGAPVQCGVSLERIILRGGPAAQARIVALSLALIPPGWALIAAPKALIDALGDPARAAEARLADATVALAVGVAALVAHGAIKLMLNRARVAAAERMRRRLRVGLMRAARGPAARAGAVAALTQEVEPVGGFAADLLAAPLTQGGALAVALGFLAAQHPAFAALCAAAAALSLAALRPLQARADVAGRARVEAGRALTRRLTEGAPIGVALGACAALEAARLEHFARKFVVKWAGNLMIGATPFALGALGAALVASGDLSVGALVAALLAQREIGPALRELAAYEARRSEARMRFTRLGEIGRR